MSKNIINTIGHHVFKYLPPDFTEKGIPFLAKNSAKENESSVNGKNTEYKFQFLGEGYYFWDDNIARAHKWGNSRYKGRYLIMELPLQLKGNRFLDLVSSREDLRLLLDVMKEVAKEIPDLKLGAFFHVMQTMEKHQPGTWPYSIIRALNVKANAVKLPFNHIKGSDMLLDPEIIICFYEKKELNLHSIRYIDKTDKEWTPKKS